MKKRIMTVLVLCFIASLFMVSSISAFAAAESSEIKIPVSATGANCTAVLCDEEGEQIQTIALTDGKAAAFEIYCEGLGSHIFTIALLDQDTDVTVFDKTKYTVDVELFYSDDNEIFYTITADPVGVIGQEGKPEKLEFINTSASNVCEGDPPVKKRVIGNPPAPGVFIFEMKAADPSFPMPEDSMEGIKTVTISGPGDVEFGTFSFTKAGVYEYTVLEKNTGADGYIYDTAIYTIRFIVTDQDGKLEIEQKIFKNGNETDVVSEAVFTNTYQLGPETPKTGDDSNTVVWIAAAGVSLAALILIAIIGRRYRKK
ncbi:MAG: Spy0128 family protein [Emergencia sp.]